MPSNHCQFLIFTFVFLYLFVQFVLQLKGFKQEAELPILVNRKLKMIEEFLDEMDDIDCSVISIFNLLLNISSTSENLNFQVEKSFPFAF